jgi:hypothetical protein
VTGLLRYAAFLIVAAVAPARLEAATLTGTITWSKAKAPEPVPVMRDRAVCGRAGAIYEPAITFDDKKRTKDVVVWIDDARGPTYLPFREVVFDQRNCTFVPHVAATTRGSIVRFKSSDPVLHTVRVTDDKGKTIVNYAMPVMEQEVSYRPLAPAELSIRCEAGHTWMRAFLKVFDHAFFAVTGDGGRYAITSVPPGEHRVVAWHPDIGRVEKKVVVPQGEGAVKLDFDLSLPRSAGTDASDVR